MHSFCSTDLILLAMDDILLEKGSILVYSFVIPLCLSALYIHTTTIFMMTGPDHLMTAFDEASCITFRHDAHVLFCC